MDPIRQLQARAAEKRDQAIAEARREYRKDIEAIDTLERRIPPLVLPIDATKLLGRPATVTDLVKAVIPNKPFTISDVMHALHAAHGRSFYYPTVRTQTSRLCSQGYLKRLFKTGHMETMYILATATVTEAPIEARTIAEVAHEILTEAARPMKVSEIAVLMRERSYRADVVPNTLCRAIRDMFKRYPGRFARGKDGRWVASGGA